MAHSLACIIHSYLSHHGLYYFPIHTTMTTLTETLSTIPLTTGSVNFISVPVLDLDLANSPSTKPKFLLQLREALVVVGFFYVKNTSVPKDVRNEFVDKSIKLCNLPLEKKMEIDMINSKHFLGYSRMGLERTAAKVDYREMFDFLTPMPPPKPDDPVWMNVQGPNQVGSLGQYTEMYLY